MHDRAARPTGAVKSAAAIVIEITILLNIDFRIAQIRPRVEKSVQRFPALTRVPASARDRGLCLRLRARNVLGRSLQPAFGPTAKAFEVATNVLVLISESNEK